MAFENAEKQADKAPIERYNQGIGGTIMPEHHAVYELKQQREYLIRKLIDIQAAIDAVNRTQY